MNTNGNMEARNVQDFGGGNNYWIEHGQLSPRQYTRLHKSARRRKNVSTCSSKMYVGGHLRKLVRITGVEEWRCVQMLIIFDKRHFNVIYRHDGTFTVGSSDYEELVNLVVESILDYFAPEIAMEHMFAKYDV